MGRSVLLVSLLGWVGGVLPSAAETATEELRRLAEGENPFALRDAVEDLPEEVRGDSALAVFRAAVDLAFGEPSEVRDRLVPLLEGGSIDRRDLDLALELGWTAALRSHDYGTAKAWAERHLRLPTATGEPSARQRRAFGIQPLLAALDGAPAQTARVGGTERLVLGNGRALRVGIAGSERWFLIDTGAGLSVLRRTEAAELGLEVRESIVNVGTATGATLPAAVTVAPQVAVGPALFRNVPFLVVDDRTEPLADGVLPAGVIGLSLLRELGVMRFRRDGVVEIAGRPPRWQLGNLAVHGLEARVRASYEGDELICRVDTGAEESVFYEPFHRRYRERIERRGRPRTHETSGLAGRRTVAGFRLPALAFDLARLGVTLRPADVYAEPLGPTGAGPDCNLGWDALGSRSAWVLALKETTLALE